MTREEYAAECLSNSLADAGLDGAVPVSKLSEVANSFKMGLDMESEAFGDLAIPDPRNEEIKNLRKNLEREKNKVHCETCNGAGRVTSYGPSHSSDSECWKCRGEGRHDR